MIIDYATLCRWINRSDGVVHGEILSNLDNLIKAAMDRDDLNKTIYSLELSLANMRVSEQDLRTRLDEAKSRECRHYACGDRK